MSVSAEEVRHRAADVVMGLFVCVQLVLFLSVFSPPVALLLVAVLVVHWLIRTKERVITMSEQPAASGAVQVGGSIDNSGTIQVTGKVDIDISKKGLIPEKATWQLFVFPMATLVFAVLIALLFPGINVNRSLRYASWTWAAVILAEMLFACLWGNLNQTAEPDLGDRLRKGAQVLVTVNGVVLGLFYKFNGPDLGVPLTVKVGAGALLVSLSLSLLAYSLFSGTIIKRGAQAVSTGVFNVSAFFLMYGLICFVFALIWP